MKRHVQVVMALLWIVLGFIGIALMAYQMWVNRGGVRSIVKGYGPAFGFCVLSTSGARAYLKRVRAGKLLLVLSSAILALYCLSYVLMVGSEFGSGLLVTIGALFGLS